MKYVSIIILIFLISCSSKTTIVSIVNSEFQGSKFRRILINAPYEDLEIKSNLESIFSKAINKFGASPYKALDEIPPLRNYTSYEISQKMKKNQIDALLVIGVKDFWVSYKQITQDKVTTKVNISSNSNTYSNASQWGYLLNINLRTTDKTMGEITTTVQKGIVLSQANYKMEARLFIMNLYNSPQMIWRSSSTTSGFFLAPNSKVLEDAANKIVKQLSIDGLLPLDRQKGSSRLPLTNEVWEIK